MEAFLWLATIALTLFIFFWLMPKWRDGTFGNKVLQFFHDYFNFKTFYIETVLKFIFVFLTCLCIVGGFLLLVWPMFEEYLDFTSELFFSALGVMILGPILIRLAYEFTMMFVLLVKNVIELNNKTKGEGKPAPAPAPQAPAYQQPQQYQQYQSYQQNNDPYKY